MPALLLLASGCSVQSRSNATARTGTAYAGDNAVTIKGDDGWYYSVPNDVAWSSTAGARHGGDRPTCLPAAGHSQRVRFASTQVTVNGVTMRLVVWVFC